MLSAHQLMQQQGAVNHNVLLIYNPVNILTNYMHNKMHKDILSYFAVSLLFQSFIALHVFRFVLEHLTVLITCVDRCRSLSVI